MIGRTKLDVSFWFQYFDMSGSAAHQLQGASLVAYISEAVDQLDQNLNLRDFQRRSLISIVQNKMTVVSARTGSGKSAVYLTLPYLYQKLRGGGVKEALELKFPDAEESPKNKAILLVLPYHSLIWELCSETK